MCRTDFTIAISALSLLCIELRIIGVGHVGCRSRCLWLQVTLGLLKKGGWQRETEENPKHKWSQSMQNAFPSD